MSCVWFSSANVWKRFILISIIYLVSIIQSKLCFVSNSLEVSGDRAALLASKFQTLQTMREDLDNYPRKLTLDVQSACLPPQLIGGIGGPVSVKQFLSNAAFVALYGGIV